MALKRTYQVDSKYTRPYKRTKSMTVPVSRRPLVPEVKELLLPFSIGQVDNGTVSAILATQITQGVAGNNRIGNRVKLLSIEVTGVFDFGSMLLVCPKVSTDIPIASYFSNGKVPFYDADRGWTLLGFSPGAIGNNTVMDYGQCIKKFPSGMNIEFDAGQPLKNALFVCFVNRTGVNMTNISGNVRLRFVDA